MDRWTVRECAEHGIFARVEGTKCPVCWRDMSEPFDVVRALGARTSDPVTSMFAALRQEPRSGSQRARIKEWVRFRPSSSAREIGEGTQINGAWKRISELVQGGHLVECGTKRDSVTKADVTVFCVPAQQPPPPAAGLYDVDEDE